MKFNFALMRHAAVNQNNEIHPDSLAILKKVGEDLWNKVVPLFHGGIRIFHSPMGRAETTAHSLLIALRSVDHEAPSDFVQINGSLAWLSCGSYKISDEEIATTVLKDDIFTILITHLPDMETYMRQSSALRIPVGNCTIWSPAGFTIPVH